MKFLNQINGDVLTSVLLGSFLIWNTITDIKIRKISSISVLLFTLVGIGFFVINKEKDVYSLAGGMAMGIGLLLLSRVSGDGIGFGDGLVVFVCGIFIGFYKNLLLLMLGLLFTAIAGVLLLIWKKAGRKSRLPFVPFLTMAYGVCVLGGFM